jgi:hypothetical protein
VPANPATRSLEPPNRFTASPFQLGSAQSGERLSTVSQHRRLAGVEIAVPEALPPEPLSPVATAAVAHSANRRHDVRTRVSLPLASARIALTRSWSAPISREEASRSAAASRILRVPTLKLSCRTTRARSRPSSAPPSATPWCCRTTVSITGSSTRPQAAFRNPSHPESRLSCGNYIPIAEYAILS